MANSRESKLTCISGGTLDGLLRAAEIFKRNGRYRVSMRQNRANPGVRDRANTMNNVLKTVSGCAQSKIHPRCKELIKDLRQVKWLSCGASIFTTFGTSPWSFRSRGIRENGDWNAIGRGHSACSFGQ